MVMPISTSLAREFTAEEMKEFVETLKELEAQRALGTTEKMSSIESNNMFGKIRIGNVSIDIPYWLTMKIEREKYGGSTKVRALLDFARAQLLRCTRGKRKEGTQMKSASEMEDICQSGHLNLCNKEDAADFLDTPHFFEENDSTIPEEWYEYDNGYEVHYSGSDPIKGTHQVRIRIYYDDCNVIKDYDVVLEDDPSDSWHCFYVASWKPLNGVSK